MKLINLLILSVMMVAIACHNSNTDKQQLAGDTIQTIDSIENNYKLVWSEEFQYKGLPDSTKWSYDTIGNSWDWGNQELQYYTHSNIENARVDGEYLHIRALKEKRDGKNYTSARLLTKNKGDWLYGRFVICAKPAGGRGTWSAIWMMPTDNKFGYWPSSGEIDILEHVGFSPDSVFASAHTEAYNHSINTNKTEGIRIPDCEQEFHEYILEWEPDEYRVYVDSTLYFTFKNENKTYKEWPFDQRFHLIINVAVGGNWGGRKGIDENIFPAEMLVDYVRVYQKIP